MQPRFALLEEFSTRKCPKCLGSVLPLMEMEFRRLSQRIKMVVQSVIEAGWF